MVASTVSLGQFSLAEHLGSPEIGRGTPPSRILKENTVRERSAYYFNLHKSHVSMGWIVLDLFSNLRETRLFF